MPGDDSSPIQSNMCPVCSVSVDQNNNTIGVGVDACWEGDASLLQDCGPDQLCKTNMEIDWFARGNFNYRIVRGCATREAGDCYAGSSSLVQYQDCSVTCNPSGGDGAGCNDGLDEVAMKFSAPEDEQVPQCYQCSYQQNTDGSVEGYKSCGDKVEVTDSQIAKFDCPTYANRACYTAASYHNDYTSGSEVEVEDDYRGCSPFIRAEDDSTVCVTSAINGLDHLNCKSTCTTVNCNSEKTQRGHQCYSCSATMDFLDRQVGVGDIDCFFDPSASTLVNCGLGVETCKTEMLVDWFGKGDQHTSIRRSCGDPDKPLPTECAEASSDRVMFKDCFDECDANACNNDLKVGLKFEDEDGYKQDNCHRCEYIEDDDGTVKGNVNCPETPTDDMISSCHSWNNVACFTGTALHNANGSPDGEREEVYKGCSTFKVDGGVQKHNETLNNGINYSLVKESCRGTACNSNHETADPIEQGLTCFVCQATKDHMGNHVGVGDRTCWSNNPSLSNVEYCEEGEVCITELIVDWFAKGDQKASIVRKCGKKPNENNKCVEGQTTFLKFKGTDGEIFIGIFPLKTYLGKTINYETLCLKEAQTWTSLI